MHIEGNRLIPLEAYRGIAAFIVLVHHYFLAFSPYTTGLIPAMRDSESFVGQPYFVFFNGTGAVAFFFTLSGFVLCWSYFNHENPNKLLLAFLKRFPRLAGIVTITTIASYLLFKLGLYYFYEASQVTKSPWLATFAYGHWVPEFEPSFIGALVQGLTTFFTGQAHYNSNLWTMKPEFLGSMIVYMLAGFIANILRYRYLSYAFVVLSLSAIGYNLNIFPFVVGAFLSSCLAKNRIQIPGIASALFIVAGLYMLGYSIPEKAYRWVAFFPETIKGYFPIALPTLGSICIIFATMTNRKVFQSLNGQLFKILGKLSFPLYLVHILVICSISSYLYLKMISMGYEIQLILLIVFAATVVISVSVSLPLSRFDDWWVKFVSKNIHRLWGEQNQTN